jgi:hypothetical protein
VDTLGLLLAVYVHAANIHDTKAAEMVMKKGLEAYPSLVAFCGCQWQNGSAPDVRVKVHHFC